MHTLEQRSDDMTKPLIYPAGSTEACRFAADCLTAKKISLVDHPTPEVTHLLLDVPSFADMGILRSGEDIRKILSMLPSDITVIGGNLNDLSLFTYQKLDLLKCQRYLAVNAAITADCALRVAAPLLKTTFTDTPTLILGWGRIGKCLGQLLNAMGASVTIAARKESDRAMAEALGFDAVDYLNIEGHLSKMGLIFNTVPEMVLSAEQLSACRNCVKIDLASKPGIEGKDVVIARGLPGKYAPESSGRLIAQTILQHFKEASL